MAVLESEGYLQQPHTSAGRVPTEKGYRFFVDEYADQGRLDWLSAQQVRHFFDARHGELEQMLHDTSRLLADLTQYAGVVVGPPHEAAAVRSVQLVPLADRMVLFVAVLSNGQIDKRTLTLDDDVSDERIAAATAHLAAHLVGRHLGGSGALPATGDSRTDGICEAVTASFAEGQQAESDNVFVGGAARMAAAFDAVETVRQVLGILEQQLVVVTLIRDVLARRLTVAIGSETGIDPLSECALVVAPYEVDGEPAGSIGVLGPTRMNYPQALAAVALVSRRLSRRLSEG
jgi:heat-inducible transcriptional repressor